MHNAPASLVIVVPVYKPQLNMLEQFSVDNLLARAPGRKIVFVAPQGLNERYYRERFPGLPFERFEDRFFASLAGYNEMMLSPMFYQRFAAHDFLLVHQTDALLFKDDLDGWMRSGHDYIGGPWPQGITLDAMVANASLYSDSALRLFVGNGGFSLRSVKKCIAVIAEAAELHFLWRTRCLYEDCFFAFAGAMTQQFSIPGADVASRFSLECQPAQFFAANGGVVPTGCHAWWKFDLPFWQKIMVLAAQQQPAMREAALAA